MALRRADPTRRRAARFPRPGVSPDPEGAKSGKSAPRVPQGAVCDQLAGGPRRAAAPQPPPSRRSPGGPSPGQPASAPRRTDAARAPAEPACERSPPSRRGPAPPPGQPASNPPPNRRRPGPASLPRADRPGAPEGPQPAEQGPSAAPGQRGSARDLANRGSRQSRFDRKGALPNKPARTLLRPQTAPCGAQGGDSTGRGRIRSRRPGRSPQINRAGFPPCRVFPYIAAGILRNPPGVIPSPPRFVYILWRRERQSKRGRRSV